MDFGREIADDLSLCAGKNVPEGEGVPDVEEEPEDKEEEQMINETMFTFDQVERVSVLPTSALHPLVDTVQRR